MNEPTTRLVLPAAAILLLGGALVFGTGAQDVQIQVHQVAGNVSYLVGQGGNIGVSAGADGVLLVDDQFLRLAPQIEKAIDEIADGEPVFLVNTHFHGDHTGGNPHFGQMATILAHTNVRSRLEQDGQLPVASSTWTRILSRLFNSCCWLFIMINPMKNAAASLYFIFI